MKNNYEIRDDEVFIFIPHMGQQYETVIDLKDLNKVLELSCTWHIADGYAKTTIYRNNRPINRILLHRYLLDFPEGLEVDHINHDKLNNKRNNLRPVTKAVNQQNRKNPKNVAQDKRSGTYYAHVTHNKKRYYSRYFKTEGEAASEAKKMREAIMKGSFEYLTKQRDINDVNLQNKNKPRSNNKTSNVRFVSYQSRTRKWRVKIKTIRYGDFDTLDQAMKRRNELLRHHNMEEAI